jgi:hypothetical protein
LDNHYLDGMTVEEQFLAVFEKHLPEKAVQYCWKLWKQDPFHFYVSKARQTKLGDFRFRKDRKIQTITINHNLNQYQFLITYVHEVAHHRTYSQYGTSVKPHGEEWKKSFQQLMSPLLIDDIFPKAILIPLRRHMLNPKASSGSDLFLAKALKGHEPSVHTLLADIHPGDYFMLQGRKFQKESLRRTRVLCQETSSGKKYLISAHAEVTKIN